MSVDWVFTPWIHTSYRVVKPVDPSDVEVEDDIEEDDEEEDPKEELKEDEPVPEPNNMNGFALHMNPQPE
nr:hypothetical protein [Tanacetum cinerariifolium]GFB85339.1 hypothetical protein [Tanacetum cinerariifolium]